MDWPILSTLTFLPLVGAVFILIARGDAEVVARNARNIALWTSGIVFFASLALWINFDVEQGGFQFEETAPWIAEGIGYHMGIDGLSMPFILLTTLLTPICVLASWTSIHSRVREYMIAFLVLETMMIGVFSALDFVLFYLFFEGGLIPMFLIIGIWGSDNRVYATFKFFLYTLLGSVLMLLGILWLYFQFGTTDLTELARAGIDPYWQQLLWLGFFAAFAVKIPMWPVHTWLPDAHVQAPTAGSVILAAVMLKIGAYGFLRISIPILPDATVTFTPLVYTMSVIAIVYTSLVALMQEDMKKLIAYSSIAHMGFVTIGLFTFTPTGIEGALMVMLSHGLVSAALFLCVGVVYDRMHTRLIAQYGGLVSRMPLYAAAFLVFTLANVGLPGTSGFVGEFLVLVGAFQDNTLVATLAATSVILSAAYALWLFRRVVFGALTKAELKDILDLNRREVAMLLPLVALIILFGVWPMPLLDLFHAPVENLIEQHELALNGLRGVGATLAAQ
ncbi:MAG: NADH-quinone oxidoreductase subunit M [Alphaproteobacteria bacterium]|nr:NADH-quinone oxidoreductase subunit M [Alphaproteobacteria bacterium]